MSRAAKPAVAAAILVVALGLRVAEVQATPDYHPINDAGSYLTLASEIAHTGDYSLSHRPGSGAGGTKGPSAYYAPAYPYLLAAVDVIDGHEVRRDGAIHGARIAQAVLGTITVALIGLVALELFGATAGLIALGLAAVYPVDIELSTTLVAENLLTPLVLGAVYAGLRVGRAARPLTACGWVAGAGVLTGLATLSHQNGILILLPLMVAVWKREPRSLVTPALLVLTAALMIAPWTIRNADRRAPVHPGLGRDRDHARRHVQPGLGGQPHASLQVADLLRNPGRAAADPPGKPSNRAADRDRLQSQALRYIADHPLAPLAVAYHNTLRLFELEGSYAWHASAKAMSLPIPLARAGVFSFWVLCLLALAGAFTKLVRGAPRWIWFVPLLLALSVVVVNVETPRFRAPVDPFLILLAAAGLATAAGWLARRLRRPPVVGEARSAVPARPAQLVEMRQRLA